MENNNLKPLAVVPFQGRDPGAESHAFHRRLQDFDHSSGHAFHHRCRRDGGDPLYDFLLSSDADRFSAGGEDGFE